MTIARRYERVSDQAKSICHETIYLCTGQYAKHDVGTLLYRVIFVDQHHGCLSRMAEAIGRGLARSDVQFESGGLHPQPLPPSVVEVLKEKGLPPETLNHVRAVSSIDGFHLVIAFSRAVANELPVPSRKAAELVWNFPDPCNGPDDDPGVRNAVEKAHRSLSEEIAGLVANLTGEDQSLDRQE
jgi:protein-tyrosine-phosphatase